KLPPKASLICLKYIKEVLQRADFNTTLKILTLFKDYGLKISLLVRLSDNFSKALEILPIESIEILSILHEK
ncbi:MAG: hypothetical protein MHPSP_000251, partial [Paramarteilia canceri]